MPSDNYVHWDLDMCKMVVCDHADTSCKPDRVNLCLDAVPHIAASVTDSSVTCTEPGKCMMKNILVQCIPVKDK